MHLSIQIPVVEESQFMSSISLGPTTVKNQENKTKACRDFLEKLKYLFLRARNPQKSVFEELVQKVFKSTEGTLQKEEIITFVDKSATTYVLGRWLNTTNLEKLKAKNSMHRLCKFI
ncbi:hypothetical protein C2G38_2215838 [Gigaspora rosea]|uniref:Uncharacterized protein n=1 Tax=Gigaspora rosea TaxID=44941 RepID=A0A397U9E8_9GLOM|nr:hypothetical protein C2G38_2215838 [Gigaspora rosea]